MKKGFTLIELLIVMVIVGVLVAVSLPKYYAAMEHGRSLEGLTNLKAASELLNARYIINGNRYLCNGIASSTSGEFTVSGETTGNFTKTTHFDVPRIKIDEWPNCNTTSVATVKVSIERKGPEKYTLTAVNQNGGLQYITCTPGAGADANICENVGADFINGEYRISYGR